MDINKLENKLYEIEYRMCDIEHRLSILENEKIFKNKRIKEE